MTRPVLLLLALGLPLTSHAKRPTAPSGAAGYEGPRAVSVDLLRPEPGGSRIYVQATLPDGERGLFLVDTGAAVSVLSAEAAERLGLDVRDTGGFVSGLGGASPHHQARVGALVIGEATLPDVDFAIGVRGVPEYAAMMPLDGILGNNIWSRFDLEIDYHADRLVLRRPGTMRIPRRSEPMFFDGSFVYTPIVVNTAAEPSHSDRIVIQLDTGASELLLSGPTGSGIAQDYTEGLEMIRGIGASETLPPSRFQQFTRRVPLSSVELGGRTVDVTFDARWINFDGGAAVGPDGLRGLAGHELFDGRVALFDFADGRFALRKSRRPARQVDGHRILLEQDVARYGDDPSRGFTRSKLQLGLGDTDEATRLLDAYVADHPDDSEARIHLAALLRFGGELERTRELLSHLSPADLVDEEELLLVVNALILEGAADAALTLARAAREARPQAPIALVALADALLASGDPEGANVALLTAASLEQYPDAYLVRRARVALARGDRNAATAHMRKLVQIYPSGGPFLWFYAMLIEEGADAETFREDMAQAIRRLHPQHHPLDFMVAAHALLGDEAQALSLMHAGIARDCDQEGAAEDNCVAWYMALAGDASQEPLDRIERAIAADGNRSDFLDTKAMVHLVRGEYDVAHEAALAAARLSPGDWYMLWQASRIGAMTDAGEASARP